MSAPTTDAPTDAFPPARHAAHPFIPRMIRRLAIPIILGWIAIIAVLNVVVPQLETVGQMRAVSMSPDDAPSMIAMKRVPGSRAASAPPGHSAFRPARSTAPTAPSSRDPRRTQNRI